VLYSQSVNSITAQHTIVHTQTRHRSQVAGVTICIIALALTILICSGLCFRLYHELPASTLIRKIVCPIMLPSLAAIIFSCILLSTVSGRYPLREQLLKETENDFLNFLAQPTTTEEATHAYIQNYFPSNTSTLYRDTFLRHLMTRLEKAGTSQAKEAKTAIEEYLKEEALKETDPADDLLGIAKNHMGPTDTHNPLHEILDPFGTNPPGPTT